MPQLVIRCMIECIGCCLTLMPPLVMKLWHCLQERGARVGGQVGYSVRLDTRTSAATQILFCTTGQHRNFKHIPPIKQCRLASSGFEQPLAV